MRERSADVLRTGKHLLVAVVACGLLASGAVARAADRPADEILKDLAALKPPVIDSAKIQDRAYLQKYREEFSNDLAKRSKLITELYKAHPDHERVPALLSSRWTNFDFFTESTPEELIKEADFVLGRTSEKTLKASALFLKARVALMKDNANPAAALPAIDAFVKAAPGDPRGASLLYSAARSVTDTKIKTELEDRIVKEFPKSPYVASIEGARKQRESVGKPFDLEFADAIKGTSVSIKGLKGKVVVIDFWATWCGPCVAELPNMKKLYAEFKDKGVEFIGVSLDQPEEKGGLKALKDFVSKNEIGWPQYYQGNFWQSKFSASWGINAIPSVFVVDQAGKLYSVEARGKLETMIPELLKKGKSDSGE
jgi:thiol-disulfide isomerase/thioredoxin